MKHLKIEQSNADIISHSGLSLIGQAIKHHTNLSRQLDANIPLRHGIKHSEEVETITWFRLPGEAGNRNQIQRRC
jgi:hypothetical protein